MKTLGKILTMTLTLLLALNCFAAGKKAAKKPAKKGSSDVEIFTERNNRSELLKGILPENVKTIACIVYFKLIRLS